MGDSRNIWRKRSWLPAALGLLAVPLVTCFVVNLAVGHTLDWFFIVLAALAVFASCTVVPMAAPSGKGLWAFGCFAASLTALLFVCALYSSGDWFWMAAVPSLGGLTAVCLPFLIGRRPLYGKGLLVMTVDTVIVYAVIVTAGLYTGVAGYWRPALGITTAVAAYGWVIFLLIRYGRGNGWIRAGLCLLVSGAFFSVLQDIILWLLEGTVGLSMADANLLCWQPWERINANIYLLMLLIGCGAGLVLLVVGWLRRGTSRRTHQQ